MFDPPAAAALYCLLVAAVFLGLWLTSDRRDHRRFETERRQVAFHCIRCDLLYTGAVGAALRPCPRCGHPNGRLRF
jgi:hypothetical protein